MSKVVVGITAGRKYENYLRWIMQVPDVEVIRLAYEEKNGLKVRDCDGVVFTGGEDVHPKFYGKPEYTEKYHLDDFDEARDTFELDLLASAMDAIPVLGICRGLQITNVFCGGTLVPDIPSFGKPDHTKYAEGKDRYHSISTVGNTILESITANTGEVNSAHHQSVDKPGDGLIINATSADGVVEGMERKLRGGHPYLMLVQWHPERMNTLNSPFSENIRRSFISSIRLN